MIKIAISNDGCKFIMGEVQITQYFNGGEARFCQKSQVFARVIMNNNKFIQWTNVYSGESGYVQMIRDSKNHFVNTAEKSLAKKYRSEIEARRAVDALIKMGEGRANVFTIVD